MAQMVASMSDVVLGKLFTAAANISYLFINIFTLHCIIYNELTYMVLIFFYFLCSPVWLFNVYNRK